MKKVYDIETLIEMFLYCDIDIDSRKKTVFEISARKNELYALVKYLREEKITYHIGFNNVSFDGQVIQYILDNYEKWIDLSNLEIVEKIYQFAQDVIDDTNNGMFPPYREKSLDIQQMDLFKIHHYDNEARRCSLKWLEFSMDMENIEEMPIHHATRDMTDEMLDQTIEYCWNDIDATERFYMITIGETEFEEYRGKNKVQQRLDLIAEMKLPKEFINYSDVKIGDELNKIGYCKEANVKPKDIYELVKGRAKTQRKKFSYGDCIPDYVVFQTEEFKSFHSRIRKEKVDLNEKQEFPFTYKGTKYMIAKGGIHSSEKKRILEPRENELLVDADIGSQYPRALIKRKIFPSHLGLKWLINYEKTSDRRLENKEKAKKEDISAEVKRVFEGVAEFLKLSLNGGGFGKLNERTNWQYDPFALYKCTIGNQFEILMLIESLELAGIHIVSANTDGIVCLFEKDFESKYYEICHEWERKVGNDVIGKLEYTYYSKMVQTSVNDYIAIKKKDGKVKKKGDFLTAIELHKNKSRRVIPIALEQYFLKGTPVEDTIMNHKNIFDFCIGVKSSNNYHYEAIDRKTYEKTIYHRLVRYFVSTDGKKLLKIKNEDSDSTGNEITQCEAGNWLMTVFNVASKKEDMKDFNINCDYYIEKAKEVIEGIERPRKKKLIVNKQQISMF